MPAKARLFSLLAALALLVACDATVTSSLGAPTDDDSIDADTHDGGDDASDAWTDLDTEPDSDTEATDATVHDTSSPEDTSDADDLGPSEDTSPLDVATDVAAPGVTCDGDAVTGTYCAGDKVTGGQSGTLYFCDAPGAASVEEVCANGCVVAEPGRDDHCAADGATCDADASRGTYCAGDKVTGGARNTLYFCNGPGSASVAEVCDAACVVAPAGQDDHCPVAGATCDANASTGDYCAGDKVSNGEEDTLYRCAGPGPATVRQVCAHGCFVAPSGQDDYCAAAAATCDANASTGFYCAGDKVSNGVTHTLYRCQGPGTATVAEVCSDRCVVAPAGQDDHCSGGSSTGYRLPYRCGTTQRCSNGNNTSTHTGTDRYAYDFAMPVGTSVRAMRAGTVHRVRIVSRPGSSCYNGGGSSCANLANTVEVRHGDGTIGLYMHISSASVSTGQRVTQGQELAKSGNTGWSTGPHLHVQVQSNCGIWWCQSRSFDFEESASLTGGSSVASQNCP